ncbi:PAS domain-containing protein [Muricoccus aerilatus]|uniref:PAS domain-containing protein n=1 Tax=Muricoccus aerilatus TaxID=452982 RepID=UPI0005C23347|nr:PAS domain-containing protein [Roseomonas aerilata]
MNKAPDAGSGATQGATSDAKPTPSPELAAAHAELATATSLNEALRRVNAEQAASGIALRESEDELWHTVELSPQIPWTADPDGNITGWSARWLELAGLAGRDMEANGWTQVPHPEDLPRMIDAWTRSIQTGEPYNIEHRIRLADGSFRWMRSRALPRLDPEGRIMRWYGTTEDIEDRKRAEIRLLALVELGDRLRDLRDPGEIAYAAAEIIGRTLEADRAGYGVVDAAEETLRVERDWTAEGVSSLKGVFQLSHYWAGFVQALRRGEVVLTNDTQNDPRTAPSWGNYAALGIHAAIHVPAVYQAARSAWVWDAPAGARPLS